jgi:hypothetical protein
LISVEGILIGMLFVGRLGMGFARRPLLVEFGEEEYSDD